MSWHDDYRSKRMTAREAVRLIKSGDRVFTSGNVATPRLLFRALIDRKHELERVQLNRTTGHWYSMKLCENTLTVRSERSRASGEGEEQAGRESGGLRLPSTMLKPNGQDATASEEVYESCVVRFSPPSVDGIVVTC